MIAIFDKYNDFTSELREMVDDIALDLGIPNSQRLFFEIYEDDKNEENEELFDFFIEKGLNIKQDRILISTSW
jgi:hypothetical protein